MGQVMSQNHGQQQTYWVIFNHRQFGPSPYPLSGVKVPGLGGGNQPDYEGPVYDGTSVRDAGSGIFPYLALLLAAMVQGVARVAVSRIDEWMPYLVIDTHSQWHPHRRQSQILMNYLEYRKRPQRQKFGAHIVRGH